jgi:hypothetical protein
VYPRVTAKSAASELLLAVPAVQQDLYALHQAVWERVSRAQVVRHAPTILYRRDKGLARVRVSDCAVHGGLPTVACFRENEVVSLTVRMALSRNGKPMRGDSAHARVCDLVERNGMDPIEIEFSCWRATGRKDDMLIELGVADVEAKVRIRQPESVAHAWRHGIGRGKRFGFGMMVIKA